MLHLIVYKLALFSIPTRAGSNLVPLLAHLSFVVFVGLISPFLHFLHSVSIHAFVPKLTEACLLEIPADFSLVMDFKVGHVAHHLALIFEAHLLLGSFGLVRLLRSVQKLILHLHQVEVSSLLGALTGQDKLLERVD
jgi:hypothetical protein